MFRVRCLVSLAVVSGCLLAGPAIAEGSTVALSVCRTPDSGNAFHGRAKPGCEVVAPQAARAPNPERWMPWTGSTGQITYLDLKSMVRDGSRIGLVVMRNLPSSAIDSGVIRTAQGDPIRSSLKRVVLDCLSSTYAVFEQTLFGSRYAKGEPLMTFRYPAGKAQSIAAGSAIGQLSARFCGAR